MPYWWSKVRIEGTGGGIGGLTRQKVLVGMLLVARVFVALSSEFGSP